MRAGLSAVRRRVRSGRGVGPQHFGEKNGGAEREYGIAGGLEEAGSLTSKADEILRELAGRR